MQQLYDGYGFASVSRNTLWEYEHTILNRGLGLGVGDLNVVMKLLHITWTLYRSFAIMQIIMMLGCDDKLSG